MEFKLNFCEYNRMNQDYDKIYRPNGREDYLFLLLKTPMKFYIDNHLYVTRENACMLYTPGTPQHYEAVRKFRNSYLHFTCAENLGTRYGIPVNEIFYPENTEEIDEYIRRLQVEYIVSQSFDVEQEYYLTCQMMIAIRRSFERSETIAENELYETFFNLRMELLTYYERPWTMEQLCKMTHLEKSQFYNYYQQFFGNSPRAELLQVRLEKAKNLLSNQALTVKQVAAMSGFSNISHFSRYFKKQCGCSPREYHKKIQRRG